MFTALPRPFPLAKFAIDCTDPPQDIISHSLRRASSLKKSNSALGETGSQTEETADKITPRGSPGSFKFFLELILMSSPVLLVSLVHVWKLDAPTAWQKLHVILCANFKMLFLPANVATPVESFVGTFVAMLKTRRSH
ncbi:hypothetical protein V8G54_000441 [Vigna mungo]|uniref:Uncharacterized protein n=1 Tax=Vigna mungo TaxID=3915 RepID=A0AAQ3P6X4_VIGMU